jgi:hypothetical protein
MDSEHYHQDYVLRDFSPHLILGACQPTLREVINFLKKLLHADSLGTVSRQEMLRLWIVIRLTLASVAIRGLGT